MSGMDMSEVHALTKELQVAGDVPRRGARAVVERGANNIKRGIRAQASGSRHFGQIAAAVRYDLRGSGDTIEAEIGYDKGSPGSLANIAVFGTSRGGGTVADPVLALEAEVPRFEQALLDLVEKSL